jgi:hypothetical protein
MPGRVVIFVSHGDREALRLAGSCALTASALGDRVDVFLFSGAVAAVVEGKGDGDHPAALLHQARAGGNCRLLGCSASVVEQKVDMDQAHQALDAVVGWPTVMEWSRGVVDRFVF